MIETGKGRLWFVLASLVALVAITAPATAAAKDRNRDRIPDRWEKRYNLSLKKDQRKLDQDRDGLRNRAEWLAGTSPRDRDTDDDGVTDLREKAGVISAWDPETMTLVIDLYQGANLSGTVSEYTKVKCPPAAEPIDEGELLEPQVMHFGGPRRGRGPHRAPPAWARPSGDRCGANCSLDDLAVGVEVEQVDVRYTAAGLIFTKLKIDAPAPDPEPEPEPEPDPDPEPEPVG